MFFTALACKNGVAVAVPCVGILKKILRREAENGKLKAQKTNVGFAEQQQIFGSGIFLSHRLGLNELTNVAA